MDALCVCIILIFFCDQNTDPEQVFIFASKDEFTLLISSIKRYHSINNDAGIVIVPSIFFKKMVELSNGLIL